MCHTRCHLSISEFQFSFRCEACTGIEWLGTSIALTRLPVSGWLGLRVDAFYVSADINLTSKLIAAYRICARMLRPAARELQPPRTSHNNNIYILWMSFVSELAIKSRMKRERRVSIQWKRRLFIGWWLLLRLVVVIGGHHIGNRACDCDRIQLNASKWRRSTYINASTRSHSKCAAAGETAEHPSKSNSNGNNIRDFNDFPSDASHILPSTFTSCILKLSSAAYMCI